MESIGQFLKAARERRQMTVADVAAATKMKTSFVEAIEADNFNALLAPIYARGFVKLYAEFVGVDPHGLLGQLNISGTRTRPAAEAYAIKAQPKSAIIHAEKITPKNESEKTVARPKDDAIKSAAIRAEKPPRVPIANPQSLRRAPLSPKLWKATNWAFIARLRRLRFKRPEYVFRKIQLPPVVWRRIFMLAGLALLVVAVALAWELSSRGAPNMTDACRWLADPPAPYLEADAKAMPSGH